MAPVLAGGLRSPTDAGRVIADPTAATQAGRGPGWEVASQDAERTMTIPRACIPLELRGGKAVRVSLAPSAGFVVLENETHRALHARVSVDPVTLTVTVVVGEDPPLPSGGHAGP